MFVVRVAQLVLKRASDQTEPRLRRQKATIRLTKPNNTVMSGFTAGQMI